MTDTPFPGSYWVLPDQLLAGEYPGHRFDVDQMRTRTRALLESGIRVIIDLTQPGELTPYQPALEEQSVRLGVPVEYERFSIRDFSVPSQKEMKTILDRIDRALSENKPVYVHCWGGIGRTGTVVACFMVRHTLQPQTALGKLKELRQGTPDGDRPSPESDEQREFVLKWKAWE